MYFLFLMKFLDYLVVFCFVSISSLTITFAWIEFWYCVMLFCSCIQHKMSFFLNTSQNHILLRLPSFFCFAITTNYNIDTHLSTLFLLIFLTFFGVFLTFIVIFTTHANFNVEKCEFFWYYIHAFNNIIYFSYNNAERIYELC